MPIASAERDESSPSYQLAILNAKGENPELAMMDKKITPDESVIAEFEWILQSLHNRCLESDNAIVTTIVETWKVTRRGHLKLSLLDVSRELEKMAGNTSLFGTGKVQFGVTSKYWLAKYYLPNSNKTKR
jgi:hypothetical protein